ncbi:MAG: hypothetical protein FWD61_17690, partial [Phycisphaerales bacterium]|nr:hypothetical protein [Phycisphaerales bacterium]
MTTPEQQFRDFLRQHKLKYTTERLAILNAVQKFARPFEAEELLLTLRDFESLGGGGGGGGPPKPPYTPPPNPSPTPAPPRKSTSAATNK